MILDKQDESAFQEYIKPLEKLERKFNKAGIPVKLRAFIAPRRNKMVMVETTYTNQKLSQRFMHLICIEGASPVQAVKDVAAEVNHG